MGPKLRPITFRLVIPLALEQSFSLFACNAEEHIVYYFFYLVGKSTRGNSVNFKLDNDEATEEGCNGSELVNSENTKDSGIEDARKISSSSSEQGLQGAEKRSLHVPKNNAASKQRSPSLKQKVFGSKEVKIEEKPEESDRELKSDPLEHRKIQRKNGSLRRQKILHRNDKSIDIDSDSSDTQSLKSFELDGDGGWDNISQHTLFSKEGECQNLQKTSAVSSNVVRNCFDNNLEKNKGRMSMDEMNPYARFVDFSLPSISFRLSPFCLFFFPLLFFAIPFLPCPALSLLSFPFLSFPFLSSPFLSFPFLSFLSFLFLSFPSRSFPFLYFISSILAFFSYSLSVFSTSFPFLSYHVIFPINPPWFSFHSILYLLYISVFPFLNFFASKSQWFFPTQVARQIRQAILVK